jgi:hypothetical protein
MTPERREEYAGNFDIKAQECRDRAGNRCEHCGIKQFTPMVSRRNIPYYIYLHAAHKNHDYENEDAELICLCPTCHARYDNQWRERQKRLELEQLRHRYLLRKKGYYACLFKQKHRRKEDVKKVTARDNRKAVKQ